MKYIPILILSFILGGCQTDSKPDQFKLRVNLSGDYPETIQLKIGHQLYTSEVVNSQALFSDTLSYGMQAQLQLNDSTSTTSFFINPQTQDQSISLLVDRIVIDRFSYLETTLQQTPNKVTQLVSLFHKFQNGEVTEKLFLREFNRFKANHRQHQVNGYILSELAYDNQLSYKKLKLLKDQTHPKAFTLNDSKRFDNYFTKRKQFQKGNSFFNFELKNLNQELVSLNELDCKLCLVEFWSTWPPELAMVQNTNLLTNYRKNKAKGFEVVAISLNTNRSDWLSYVLQRQMPWINLRAEQGFTSHISSQMGITHLPQNYLIDQSGTIIAKNIALDELQIYQDLILDKN